VKRNKVKEILKRGEAVAVPEVNRLFSPKLIEILALSGYECVWIDMEHSDLSYECLSELAMAARAMKMDVIVRIAKGGYTSVIRPLELGVNGLVLPHCRSAEEARQFVQMAKFTPLGLRGIGAGRDSNYGLTDLKNYIKDANKETLLIVQIEDKEGVDNVDNIAAVEEIDVLFIGPVDLSQSYRVVGELDHSLIQKAIEKVALVCKKYKKSWGLPVEPTESMQKMLDKGAQFLNITNEASVLLEGFRKAKENSRKEFRKHLKGEEKKNG